jgi:uncharacterized protein (DUF58 family)
VILPAPRLLVLLAGWTALGLAASVWPATRVVWTAVGAALVMVAAVDGWRGRRAAQGLTVTRVLPPILPVGRPHAYHVRLHTTEPLEVTVTDVLPIHVDEPPTTHRVRIPGARQTRVGLSVRPTQRGRFPGGSVTTRVRSPWRLCDWQASHSQANGVRVFPDISGAAGGALETGDLRVPPAGARRAPRRGHGLEFKELRDYREGDALRLVDWKASARRGRPITREYEDQRDQQVLLALDCGHRMRTRDDALAHFDHVLNAALRLAAVALAQGDAVGCATMADAEPRLLLPRKSRASLRRLVQGLYDVQPGHLVPDYLADARRLHDRLRRHSLVVLLTTLRDEDEEELLAATRLLRRRHRVTVASVRERVLDTLAHADISSEEDGARWASTLEYLQARAGVMGRLRQRGVDVIDVPPEQLSSALTAHYWHLKRAGTM